MLSAMRLSGHTQVQRVLRKYAMVGNDVRECNRAGAKEICKILFHCDRDTLHTFIPDLEEADVFYPPPQNGDDDGDDPPAPPMPPPDAPDGPSGPGPDPDDDDNGNDGDGYGSGGGDDGPGGGDDGGGGGPPPKLQRRKPKLQLKDDGPGGGDDGPAVVFKPKSQSVDGDPLRLTESWKLALTLF